MRAQHQGVSRLLKGLMAGVTVAASFCLNPARPALAQTGATLELADVPAEARTAFMGGIDDLANWFPTRGLTRLEEALRLDPDFGLARVFWAAQATGMDIQTRTAELDRGVHDASSGSAGEAAFALALRAQRLNRPDEADRFFEAASELLPGDPWVAYFSVRRVGVAAGNAQLDGLQRVIARFPDLAPAHNSVAYVQYRTGDRAGGMESIRKYAELAPDHPNAKDSYAELLQWEGLFDEAVDLYREAIELDPTFMEAFIGIADARQLQGRGADARAALGEALGIAPTPVDRVNLHRFAAMSYGADHDRKGAEQALAQAMSEANANAMGMLSGVHRDYARVNAMTGNRGGVASHLAATTTSNPALHTIDAMLLASVGLNAEARAKLEAAQSAEGPAGQVAYFRIISPIVRGLILVNEGNGGAAITEIQKGNVTLPLAKAVMALAEQQRKNVTAARMLRDGVRSDRVYSLIDRDLAIARMLADRVK